MSTPQLYFKEKLVKCFEKYGITSFFHQTSINNFESILSDSTIYSPGTIWGMGVSFEDQNSVRKKRKEENRRMIAERGFIDYVFTSLRVGSSLNPKALAPQGF